jgi:predicted glycogen debranching enzyme
MPLPINKETEWLEADGLGGFAMGTTNGIRTRRYHSILLTATTPPTGRVALVKGLDVWVEFDDNIFHLNSNLYFPGVTSPNGAESIEAFQLEPWPKWIFRLPKGMTLEQELFVPRGASAAVISWKLMNAKEPLRLSVRPLLAFTDYHSLQKENPNFRFDAEIFEKTVVWKPYDSMPTLTALHNGHYHHQPNWYHQFLYAEEQARGLDCVEDLASPGLFQWNISKTRAILIFCADGPKPAAPDQLQVVEEVYDRYRTQEEERRSKFPDPMAKAAESYFVKRGQGETLIAGYPWFTDWGRDTFVAIRGLGLATGRIQETRKILLEWAKAISEGMVPNRFPDQGEAPEYHSVDASLWYIIASYDYLKSAREGNLSKKDWSEFQAPVEKILRGYSQGTRWGIQCDVDGLLWAGEGDDSLTWMDARVNNRAVTPRVGKPIEVEALWVNALWVGGHFSEEWETLFKKALTSFQNRFWNGAAGYCYDVVDVKRQPGTGDASFRPNQILALGGLPLTLLDDEKVKLVLAAVESKLWTPMGLRTLAPNENGYRRQYKGGVLERDSAYHQGTVWPWLMGPFVDAWVRSRGNTHEAKEEAREKFLTPLLERLNLAGLGHLAEIADGDEPFTPRGCPFQAWSLGEAIRLDHIVLK